MSLRQHFATCRGTSGILIAFSLATIPGVVWGQSIAEWQTSMGMFRAELREDLVPITAGNFIDLTNAGFYDGCIFHRVIDDFVIQDGDPTGTGEGGPGYNIPDEFHPDLLHDDAGVLAMANEGTPNTGGSQYYITLAPQPHLDGFYAVFGKVINGIDVVQAIGDVPTGPDDRPLVDVVIDSLRILGVVYPHLELEEIVVDDDPADSDDDGVVNPLESGLVLLEIRNWEGWCDANDAVATLTCDDPRVLISYGEVDLGSLAEGDSVSNAQNPFRFEITANETFDAILHLEITANESAEHPYLLEHDIDLHVSLSQAGWPAQFVSASSPVFADLDQNGSTEVIFGDYSGFLHAVMADGITEVTGFPLDTEGSIRTSVAVGDLGGDGTLEVALTRRSPHSIMAVDYTGTILFDYPVSEYLLVNPVLADIDGNGTLEIITLTLTTGQVVVLSSDGSDFGPFPVALGEEVRSSPAVGDVDGDGFLDVVVVSQAAGGTIHVISGATGSEVVGWPYVTGSKSEKGPIIANIDAQGRPEIVAGFDSGELIVLNHDGTVHFSADVGAAIKTSVVMGNLDQDGPVEIIFLSDDGFLHVFQSSASEISGFPLEIGAGSSSTPVLADLNDNGTVDVIFGADDELLHVIDIDGSDLAPFPVDLGSELDYGPAIADLDQDGDPEIAVSAGAIVAVLDAKAGGNIVWPCFKGNTERTGNTGDIPTGVPGSNPVMPSATRLMGIYPNPSDRQLTILFAIRDPDVVHLCIYDLAGHEVRQLVSKPFDSGHYSVVWNGRDARGTPVPSGTYLGRLSTRAGTETKRVLLLP